MFNRGILVAECCNGLVLDKISSAIPEHFELIEAEDYSAIEESNHLRPDVFIVCQDWNPEHNNYLIEQYHKVPILMILEKEDSSIRVRARQQGVVGFLQLSLLSESLALAVDNLMRLTGRPQKTINESTDEDIQSLIQSIDRMLQHHPALGVKAFCRAQNISQSSLYRKVKNAMGIYPAQLIMQRRCHRAAGLIRNTEQRISQVAYEVGFSSPAYFSKVFKKVMGCSPKDYREGGNE